MGSISRLSSPIFSHVHRLGKEEIPLELYEGIKNRRTIRKFKAPPAEEQLKRIITAGGLAPSAFNRQGWDVVIVDDPVLLEKIAGIKYRLNRALKTDVPGGSVEDHAREQKEAFKNTALLMIYQRVGKNDRETRYDGGSAWLLMENICLAAVAEGLGTRIVSFWEDGEEEVNQLLKMPEGKKQVSGINIGVPNEAPGPRSLKPREKWVHRNHF
jgi:nitroreductase